MSTTLSLDQVRDRAPPLVEPAANRLAYVDNLKVVLVVGVIVTHAALIYTPTGPWLYKEHAAEMGTIARVGLVGLVAAIVWMGPFFLMAGLFAPQSLSRKGPGRFVRDRLIRLGGPLVVYIFVMMPLMRYIVYICTHVDRRPLEAPAPFLWRQIRYFESGPMWFVAVLLGISLLYVAWSMLRRGQPETNVVRPMSPLDIATASAAIGILTFVAHLVWPINSFQPLSLHVWQWPQYFVLFAFGVVSAHRGWLIALPPVLWRWCGWAILATVVVAGALFLGVAAGPLDGQADTFLGGWHWQAFVAALIEGVLAVCGTLWFLELFRRKVTYRGPIAAMAARSVYGAYVLQAPALIAIALPFNRVHLAGEVKFLLVAPAAVLVSFAAAALLVRLPGARNIL